MKSLSNEEDRKEIIEALGLSHRGLDRWFDLIMGFCNKHGKEKYYDEVMSLISDYQSTLEENVYQKKQFKRGS